MVWFLERWFWPFSWSSYYDRRHNSIKTLTWSRHALNLNTSFHVYLRYTTMILRQNTNQCHFDIFIGNIELIYLGWKQSSMSSVNGFIVLLDIKYHVCWGFHDDVIKWKHFPRYWPLGNSPVTGELPAQRSVTRSLDVFFICAWINGWVNIREAGDLRRHRAHYDITVMYCNYPWSPDMMHREQTRPEALNLLSSCVCQ